MVNRIIRIFWAAAALYGAWCNAQPLSLTVLPASTDHPIPLSYALAQLGTRLQGGYVSFGIDVRNIPEPEVELKITEAEPLGLALAQVVGQARGYGYRPVSEHVIEVYPISEESNPNDVLNLRVADFVVGNQAAMNIFSRPAAYIPELKDFVLRGRTVQACGSIGPGLGSAAPGVSLSLHGVKLREVFDAVAEADARLQAHARTRTSPVGWVHRIEAGQDGRIADKWSFISSVPHDWELQVQK